MSRTEEVQLSVISVTNRQVDAGGGPWVGTPDSLERAVHLSSVGAQPEDFGEHDERIGDPACTSVVGPAEGEDPVDDDGNPTAGSVWVRWFAAVHNSPASSWLACARQNRTVDPAGAPAGQRAVQRRVGCRRSCLRPRADPIVRTPRRRSRPGRTAGPPPGPPCRLGRSREIGFQLGREDGPSHQPTATTILCVLPDWEDPPIIAAPRSPRRPSRSAGSLVASQPCRP